MNIELTGYQAKAVSFFHRSIVDILNDGNASYKKGLLKAITGSGKTVIASSLIKELSEDHEIDVSFIWISLGSGELHKQSKESIEEIIGKTNIKTSIININTSALCKNEIGFLNWESVNKKDNKLRVENEKSDLQSIIDNTKSKIILFIDESHNTSGSDKSKEIIDIINPDFILEITSTPDTKVEKEVSLNNLMHNVKSSDVVDAGIIKRSIVINDIHDIEGYDSLTDNLIKQADEKYKQLCNAYKEENVDINPLVLIQIPSNNANKDEEYALTKKTEVLESLSKLGYTTDNGEVAIWLSGEKTNTHDIKNFKSNVKFLIFKHAIATGWDCPRAHVLIKLATTKSEKFNQQILGRIMRMPERKHYKNNLLNTAYVYTDDQNYKVDMNDYVTNVSKNTQYLTHCKDDVLKLNLVRNKFARRNDCMDLSFLNRYFNFDIQTTLNCEVEKLDLKILKTNIDIVNDNKTSGDTSVSVEYKDKDIFEKYDSYMKSLSTPMLPKARLSEFICKRIMSRTGKTNKVDIYKIILDESNEAKLRDCVTKAKKAFNDLGKKVIEEEFAFDLERYSNSELTDTFKKCAYYKHFESKHKTENAFEKYIDSHDDVLYWIKNVDSGNGLSIAYTYNHEPRLFYPDYIVQFKNGSLGIYEVKDINDKDKDTITPQKIKALENYCSDHSHINRYLYGALISIDNKHQIVNVPEELRK